ncbi:MAG: MFS transporter [Acetobacteraceae bacterium]
MTRHSIFYGWRVVGVCFVAALFAWGFGVFGASVYLHAITHDHGWSIALVSSAITLFYLTNSASLTIVGSVIDRFGSRAIFIFGGVALASGVAALGQVRAPWQLYPAFMLMGLGYAVLSLTGLSATIAPWFERHQGRSVAIALMGASVGAMAGVPLLVALIGGLGFTAATLAGAAIILCVLVPLAAVVLRYRRPAELGLGRDGDPPGAPRRTGSGLAPAPEWDRARAMRTSALWTVGVAFALGLVVQVGFLTHHLKLAEPTLGAAGAGWLVSATGVTGLIGRLVLARVADRVNVRRYTAGIFGAQAVLLGVLAWMPDVWALIGASLGYGFCLGQITTLSPIVVRREFGSASFGAIYSVAATVIQVTSAFGPALYGALRDLFGSYAPVLAIAAGFELAAMVTVLAGRPPRHARD